MNETTTSAPPAKRGRKVKPKGEKLTQKGVTLYPSQWAKLGRDASAKIRAALVLAGYPER